MPVFARDSKRRRTRRFDVEAAARGTPGRLRRLLSGQHFVDALLALLFALIQTFVVTVGLRGLDFATIGGVAVIVCVLHALVLLYLIEHHRETVEDRRSFVLFELMATFVVALGRIFLAFDWPEQLFPLGVFAIAFSIAYSPQFGAFYALLTALLVGFMKGLEQSVGATGVVAPVGTEAALPLDLPLALTLAAGSLAGVFTIGTNVTRRSRVIEAGVYMGLTYAVMIAASRYLLGGNDEVLRVVDRPQEVGLLIAFGFLNGLFSGYFMVEFGLRFVEAAFDVVTDLRLQELADLNQPILKKFSIEAPGTFHHSQMVATLSEAAAEAIGANALLCRVGAYFHDLGKMAKPEYFIENVQGGVTKHQGLTPTMSTLIIIGHVKDGIEMAEEIGLPPRVIDCIPEHHGTIAVEYFYNEAVKQARAAGQPEDLVRRDDFRYPGPRPQSRESAILMISDSVEAISRIMTEPNASRIEAMVHDVVMRRLTEGQFDECGITLAELKQVEQALVRVLLGHFHGRIRYPKPPGGKAESTGRMPAAVAASAAGAAGGAASSDDGGGAAAGTGDATTGRLKVPMPSTSSSGRGYLPVPARSSAAAGAPRDGNDDPPSTRKMRAILEAAGEDAPVPALPPAPSPAPAPTQTGENGR